MSGFVTNAIKGYANCCAQVREAICRQLSQTQEAAESKRAALAVQRLDPERCPVCNTVVVTSVVYRPQTTDF
ncbi:MAG: hypothetical protein ABGZ35_24270 [Planctomycetaceae bacterium]